MNILQLSTFLLFKQEPYWAHYGLSWNSTTKSLYKETEGAVNAFIEVHEIIYRRFGFLTLQVESELE